jgi:hypothetical protein
MSPHHEKIVMPYSCMSTATLCAPVNGDVLAKLVMGTNREKCFLPMKLQVLGLEADAAEWEKMVIVPDDRWAFDDHM